MNLTQNLMNIQWNPAALTDYYIVSLSPLIDNNKSESTFITSNTTIHLPLQIQRGLQRQCDGQQLCWKQHTSRDQRESW